MAIYNYLMFHSFLCLIIHKKESVINTRVQSDQTMIGLLEAEKT